MTAAGMADGSGRMFDAIARRYDLLNRINSFGMDRGWRRRLIDALDVSAGDRVLDLATGTADLPVQIASMFANVSVVGLDPSDGMLAVGHEKLAAAGLEDRVALVSGDAQALPFDDCSFERVTMAFGIRNVPDRDRALSEIARVLVPGGRVAILELGEPRGGIFGAVARAHVRYGVPLVGALLSSGSEYSYLRRSIEAFDAADRFERRLVEAGLELAPTEVLTFGACLLFVARRPDSEET